VFPIGTAVWVECRIRKGIEEGTVKGICQSIGSLEEKRIELAKRINIKAFENFMNVPANFEKLQEIMIRNKGSTPVQLEVLLPSKKLLMRAQFGNSSIKPNDEFIQAVENTWPGQIRVERIYRLTAAAKQMRR
jgi:hypothetical protein